MGALTKLNGMDMAAVSKWNGVEASRIARINGQDWPHGFYPYGVEKSCLFDETAPAYMHRTFSAPTNNKKWTLSAWLKRGALVGATDYYSVLSALGGVAGGTGAAAIDFNDNKVEIYDTSAPSGSGNYVVSSTQHSVITRDPSSHFHLVVSVDTTQAAAADRLRIYINNVPVAYSTAYMWPQNADTNINKAVSHAVGANTSGTWGYDGYMSEVAFIDGQALTPSSFGEEKNAIWVPRDVSGLTFGTNGFHLDFADASSLGNDVSGNNNDFTTSGMTTLNQSSDTPTNNWCTMNPLFLGGGSISKGNLKSASGVTNNGANCDSFLMESGAWYWEVKVASALGSNNDRIGIRRSDIQSTSTSLGASVYDYAYCGDGNKYNNVSAVAYGDTYTTGDIIGVALDIDAGTIWFSKNGAWQASGDPSAGTGYAFSGISGKFLAAHGDDSGSVEHSMEFNFGGTNIFSITSGNADANGYGSFEYAPPAGFLALCSANMEKPGAGAAVNKPGFASGAYTGTGAAKSVTGFGFQPDLVLIRNQSTGDNYWFDSVRGATKYMKSNSTDAEATDAQSLTSFDSDGFSIGTLAGINTNGASYVWFAWKKGAEYGLDIVAYTGTGSARTVSHSLGAVPHMMVVKNRTDSGEHWFVYHKDMDASAPETYAMTLDTADARFSATGGNNAWDSTAPTSSQFTVAGTNWVNGSGDSMIAYLWRGIPGFSFFGKYTGNATSDGPFVNSNLRAGLFLVKGSTVASHWRGQTSELPGYNQTNYCFYLSDTYGGTNATWFGADLVSNGLKIRNTDSAANGAYSYLAAAWAAQPFKYANAR